MAEAKTLRPDYTRNRYPVQRGNYANIDESHIKFFSDLLGKDRVLTDDVNLEKHNVDFFNTARGSSKLVLKPKTTEEVSKILAYSNEKRLAVCPQGGNTSVVAGSVPVYDEIVLSTALMNEIISLDKASGVIVCQAGCILQDLNDYLKDSNLIMPVDLPSHKMCHIGGNVSTNAGGIRVVRYGNMHGNVLGIEAVKADGEIIDCLSTLKKDNTGYHLKHLFIGSEGTLGVVTKVAVKCATLPKAYAVALLGLRSYEKILETFIVAKAYLAEILSAFELMDDHFVEMVETNLKRTIPLSHYPFYVLIEAAGSNEKHDVEKLNAFLDKCKEDKIIEDGVVTGEPEQYKKLWSVREGAALASKYDAFVYHYDFSFPLTDFYSIIPELEKTLGDKAKRVTGFGHIGDGNIHIQIAVDEYKPEFTKLLEPYIFQVVSKYNGSISAEHGVGFGKRNYLYYSKSKSAINLMHQLKKLMDPNGILNPYKVLPDVK